MSSTFSVGKEVISYCNSCKAAIPHMIITMKDVLTIGKVECKSCGTTQRYKDPAAVAKKKKTSVRKKNKTSGKIVNVSEVWMDEISKAKNKSRKYSIREKFAKGDLVDHPTFGPGIVQDVLDNDKFEIIFQHHVKILVHNK